MKKVSLNSMMVALLFTFGVGGPALAHDRHDHQRITLNWGVEATGQMFEVKMPVEPKLRSLKQKFMVRSGIVPRDSREGHHGHHRKHVNRGANDVFEQYVVERLVIETVESGPAPTTVPSRQTGPVTVIGGPVIVERFELLDESKSLKDLGVADGDTLRLRKI
jgi:hypothetical protein